MTPEARRALATRNGKIADSRARCEAFVEYAFRHEKTGKALKNEPFHEEWHQLARDSDRLVLFAPVEHAKTTHMAVGETLHRIGNDTSLRCAVISNTQQQAVKILGSIRQHSETNPRVAEVFPDLKPSSDPKAPWHQTALTFERPTISKDPSIQALGTGSPILGSRLDFVVIDDINDFENTRTPEQRQKTVDYIDSSVLTRLSEDAVVLFIGTPWGLEDSLHVFEKRSGWVSRRYSAVLNPEDPPEQWKTLWPAQFSPERMRKIAEGTTEIDLARNYFCQVRTNASARFKEEWIRAAMAAGRGRTLLHRAPVTGGGKLLPCFTGVDLGIGQTEKHDLTVLFTIALDERLRRLVVAIESGRWTAPEIVQRIGDTHRRYNSIVGVEDNGAQSFLVQWCTQAGIPVRPWTTSGRNKYDESFGVESLAIELRAGMWVIPSGPDGTQISDEVRLWVRGLLFYTPSAHTSDHVIAAWIARELARQMSAGSTARADTTTR